MGETFRLRGRFVKSRDVDPHAFYADPDPVFFPYADPDADPDPDPGLTKQWANNFN